MTPLEIVFLSVFATAAVLGLAFVAYVVRFGVRDRPRDPEAVDRLIAATPRHHADQLDHQTLQRYLSDLARLGARYGVELVPDPDLRGMRIAPLSPEQGGYLALQVDDGAPMLSSYGEGAAPDKSTDDVVGDSFHPAAREERARLWREQNAEAIAERSDEDVKLMRELLRQRQAGEFVSAEEGRRQTTEMVERRRREILSGSRVSDG